MTTDLVIRATDGEEFAPILTPTGFYVGYAKGVHFSPKPRAGRPANDGKRVAAYLAYWLGLDSGMEPLRAREFAIKAISHGTPVSSGENIDRSFRGVLSHQRTAALTNGLNRVTIFDKENPEIAQCILFEPGFSHEAAKGKLHLSGNGWAWRPGQGLAEFGSIKYASPAGFEYTTG